MDIARTWRDLNEHCNKFITALTNVDGPVKDVALMIQQEWIDIVSSELGIGATQVPPSTEVTPALSTEVTPALSTEVLLITEGIYSECDNKIIKCCR